MSAVLAVAAVLVPLGEPWHFAHEEPSWQPPDWGDLDTHGFVVVPQWVRGDASRWGLAITDNWVRDAFDAVGPGSYALDPPEMLRTKNAMQHLVNLIRTSQRTIMRPEILRHLRGAVDASAGGSVPTGAAKCQPKASMYFFSGTPPNGTRVAAEIPYKWHTDHMISWDQDGMVRGSAPEPHRNGYLNFYAPVHKPHADDSNLQILPFSRLGGLRAQLEGHCGRAYVRHPKPNQSDPSVAYMQEVSIERCVGAAALAAFEVGALEHAVVEPQLRLGDLLVIRGDMIHRTGPRRRTQFRLAVSVRALQRPAPTPAQAGRAAKPLCVTPITAKMLTREQGVAKKMCAQMQRLLKSRLSYSSAQRSGID